MHEIIISGIVSVVTSTISAFVAFFFTKKKYQAEVESVKAETSATEVANMKESLEFYQTLSEDNKKRLIALLEENEKQRESIEKQREEISDLKAQITELTNLVREYTKGLDANADQIP